MQETRLQTLNAHTACLHMCAGMLPLHLHLHHVAPLWPTVAPRRLQDLSIHPDEVAAMGPQSISEHWSCHGCENMLQGLPAHTHHAQIQVRETWSVKFTQCFVASTNCSGTFLLFDSPSSQLWAVPALPWHGWWWFIVECQMVSDVPVLLCTDRN